MCRPRAVEHPITPPLQFASTFSFDSSEAVVAAMDLNTPAHMYSRLSNPTVEALESGFASLESAEAALAFGSGMAAIHAVLVHFAGEGGHIIAQKSVYGGAYKLMAEVLPRFGIETSFVDSDSDLDTLKAAIRPTTRVIYAETISNPILNVPNFGRLRALADQTRARLVFDSTFATPYLVRPLEHGAHIVIHSASKYLGGHGDVIAGLVAGRSEDIQTLRAMHVQLGGVCAPMTAWLILRGLATLELRMERHCTTAQRVAAFLAEHPRVSHTFFPGLSGHPSQVQARHIMPSGKYGGHGVFCARCGRRYCLRPIPTDPPRRVPRGSTYTRVDSRRDQSPLDGPGGAERRPASHPRLFESPWALNLRRTSSTTSNKPFGSELSHRAFEIGSRRHLGYERNAIDGR